MNIKHQTIKIFLFNLIVSFAFMLSDSFAKEIYFSDPQVNDSVLTKKETGYGQSGSALVLNNSQKLNSLLISGTTQILNKPSGFLLEDGTTWYYETNLNYLRLAVMAGIVLSAETIGYYRLKEMWYNWETGKLHSINFVEDFEKYLWMDKYGHFLHAYFASGLFTRGYRWAGMSGENSIIYGSISGWLWMLQIEIADGFFERWGFSWGDLIANTVGVGFSALQQVYPDALGGIQPKISYQPSKALKEKRYINETKLAIDDYEGMTFWLAVNPYHYMPKNIQEGYPEFLKPFGFALGHSAKGIGVNPQGGYREIFIGLDYDLRKLSLGDESSLIRFLKNELNIIRLPLPAVKISPDGIWYGIYF